MEETKFRELRKGQERELRKKQVVKLVENRKEDKARVRTETIRQGNLKTEQREKRDFVKEYDERLKQLEIANQEMLEADLTRKQDMVRPPSVSRDLASLANPPTHPRTD